ncbi:MAG: hypothetical protein WCA00_01755 [Candidatus Acidiferrales bacterium]
MFNRLTKLITATGIVGVATGLTWGFLDSSDFAYRFFSDSFDRFTTESDGLFLTTLLVGITLSVGGTLAWTHHFSRRQNLKVAGWVFLAGLLAMVIAPKNIHGPGMLLILTALCAWILSIGMAVIAVTTRHGSVNPIQNPD